MITVNSIIGFIHTLLSSDSMLVSSSATVVKGEPINTDAHEAPWIGIFRGTKNLVAERIGTVTPYGGVITVNIYHQEFHEEVNDAYETWQRVEDIEKRILGLVVLKENISLGGQVDFLESVISEPIFDENINQRFIMNLITLSYRGRQ